MKKVLLWAILPFLMACSREQKLTEANGKFFLNSPVPIDSDNPDLYQGTFVDTGYYDVHYGDTIQSWLKMRDLDSIQHAQKKGPYVTISVGYIAENDPDVISFDDPNAVDYEGNDPDN